MSEAAILTLWKLLNEYSKHVMRNVDYSFKNYLNLICSHKKIETKYHAIVELDV